MDATTLVRDSLVWDNHGCMPLRPDDEAFLPQLARYRAAGVDVAIINVGFGEQGVEEHLRMLAHFRRWIGARPDEYVLIDTVDDIALARATGRLAIAFDIEGANAVGDQASLVQLYYDLGVRWMLMAYNRNNRVGGGCHDEDSGLTPFGRGVLDEMARVGMVPCCTHTGYRTARDVFDYFPGPVIFSHSNPRAIYDHPRNVPDDLLHACAVSGGVVAINGIGIFLGKNDASTETFLRHVDHVVQTIGPDHVGIGLDYVFDRAELDEYLTKMRSTFPPGMGYDDSGFAMVEPERIPAIVEGMIGLGYDEATIGGVLGGNLLRVARQSWKPSR
jgi:membrane dipeptidase